MEGELSVKSKLYKFFPFKFIIERVIRSRTEWIMENISGFVKKGEKILDLGAGGGWIGKEIQKNKKANVALLDVRDFNQTELELMIYNGKKIPFADNSFGAVLLIFVLHHCEKPLTILREAQRVSQDRLIIMEDVYSSWLGKAFMYFWEFLGFFASFLANPPGENMAFNFQTFSEWEKMLKSLNLKIIYKKKTKSPFKSEHCLLVAQKN